jgi:predicted metal-dependent phosphotriesterase family hydrolase
LVKVMTVLGAVDVAALGPTLPHEHLFLNLMAEYKKEGVLNDEGLAIAELAPFVALGGRTIVDCTSVELDRDPLAIRRVAEATRLNVVMSCGHYRDPYIDRDWLDRHSVVELAANIVAEVRDGVGDTGIRPGIIGEVGSNRAWISSSEERALRAAAKAQLETGLTIMTHAARWPLGIPQLDILTDCGVDPHHVVIGHCDMVPSTEYHEAIARRGAFVEFDTIRGENEYATTRRVDWVMNLVRKGHLEQILLSQDVCLTTLYSAYGGEGYSFVFREFLPRLRAAGLSEGELETLTCANPARALTAAVA